MGRWFPALGVLAMLLAVLAPQTMAMAVVQHAPPQFEEPVEEPGEGSGGSQDPVVVEEPESPDTDTVDESGAGEEIQPTVEGEQVLDEEVLPDLQATDVSCEAYSANAARQYLHFTTSADHENGTATATVWWKDGAPDDDCYVEVAFSVYALPFSERNPLEDQIWIDNGESATKITAANAADNPVVLQVDLPGCGFQTDLYVTSSDWDQEYHGNNGPWFEQGVATDLRRGGHHGIYLGGNRLSADSNGNVLSPHQTGPQHPGWTDEQIRDWMGGCFTGLTSMCMVAESDETGDGIAVFRVANPHDDTIEVAITLNQWPDNGNGPRYPNAYSLEQGEHFIPVPYQFGQANTTRIAWESSDGSRGYDITRAASHKPCGQWVTPVKEWSDDRETGTVLTVTHQGRDHVSGGSTPWGGAHTSPAAPVDPVETRSVETGDTATEGQWLFVPFGNSYEVSEADGEWTAHGVDGAPFSGLGTFALDWDGLSWEQLTSLKSEPIVHVVRNEVPAPDPDPDPDPTPDPTPDPDPDPTPDPEPDPEPEPEPEPDPTPETETDTEDDPVIEDEEMTSDDDPVLADDEETVTEDDETAVGGEVVDAEDETDTDTTEDGDDTATDDDAEGSEDTIDDEVEVLGEVIDAATDGADTTASLVRTGAGTTLLALLGLLSVALGVTAVRRRPTQVPHG